MGTQFGTGQSLAKTSSAVRSRRKGVQIARTQALRGDRNIFDLDELLEAEEPDPQETTEITEDNRESSDCYRDDSEKEFDIPYLGSSRVVARCLLPVRPQAQWRVRLHDTGITVEPIGAANKPLTPDQTRRKAVLTIATGCQSKFLETGKTDDLQVLEPSTLLHKILTTCDDQDVVAAYKGRKLDIASDIKGQFFYDPRGALHAVRFLMQDDICGVAIARVWHALHDLVEIERREKNFRLDREVAKYLNDIFMSSDFYADQVSGWREMKSDSSTKRLYWPNCKDREAACKPKSLKR